MPENSTKKLAFASPPLSFLEVKALVQKIAPKVRLEFDGDVTTGNVGPGQKGRYLVANCALQAGEVVLSERPVFQGSTDAERSRKVYSQAFLAKLETSEDEEEDFEDDCFHPRSPLVDCVAGVLLSKKNASTADEDVSELAKTRLRQLGALCRAAVKQPVPEGAAEDLWSALRPDIQELTSEEELRGILHILSSNRFGNTMAAGMDLMFAGSMFEHSCVPNCFVGSVQPASGHEERSYRALRDVAEGEALSIDYLLLPDSYFPTSERLKTLSGWGFTCTCQRCTTLAEVERSFICPACNEHELCPRGTGPSDQELVCRSCGKHASASYASRCFAREASLLPKTDGDDSTVAEAEEPDEADSGFLGKYHYLVFQALWAQVAPGVPDEAEDWPDFLQQLEALIAAVVRLYGDERHPLLLDLFHLGALVTQSTTVKGIEAQGSYLQKEHSVLQRCYPEEAARQDEEIMALVQGKGPWTADEAADTKPESNGYSKAIAEPEDSGLGEMD
mmetsp:Transcript_78510/g.138283  ORF Transcript_78510/g.138283 Transcript_78510/m.138283 type:complete len:505 (+) Transcript_78510:76-1590(+)